MLVDRDVHVEITGLPAGHRAPSAANTDARAVVDPRRDLRLHGIGATFHARSAAHRAGIGDLPAAPAARRACAREREQALAFLDHTAAETGRTRLRHARS